MVLPADTVVVAGCSGKQGSSVTDALLKAQKFSVRGITRDPTKDRCKELQRRGVQLVQADLNQPATLKAAFQDAGTAFLFTDYFDGPGTETEQGMNQVHAALAAGVRNIVFSSLVDAERISNGRYKLDLFTNKSKVEGQLRALRSQNRFESVAFVYPGFYWQNFVGLVKPQRQQDGSFVFSFPVDPARTPICSLDITDFGPIVAKVLENPKEYDGRRIFAASECLTLTQMVEQMSEVSGKRIVAKQISDDEARRVGIPAPFIELYKFCQDYGLYGGEPIGPLARQLNPNMKTFRDFLRANNEWRANLA